MELNSNSTRLAVIDMNGILKLYDMKNISEKEQMVSWSSWCMLEGINEKYLWRVDKGYLHIQEKLMNNSCNEKWSSFLIDFLFKAYDCHLEQVKYKKLL